VTLRKIVTVAPIVATPPTPLFTSRQRRRRQRHCVLQRVQSTPGAGHTIASYAWTFGDGDTASGVTVSHAYKTAGTFSVQLKVTDEIGQSRASPPRRSRSAALLDRRPTSPSRRLCPVGSMRLCSMRARRQPRKVRRSWTSPGTSVTAQRSSTAGPFWERRGVYHHERHQQDFVAHLPDRDELRGQPGRDGQRRRTGSHNATVTVALAEPNVRLTASPASPTPGVVVQLNSDSTTYFSGANPPSFPVTFAWTFGDGGVSALRNPSHAYAAVGVYTRV